MLCVQFIGSLSSCRSYLLLTLNVAQCSVVLTLYCFVT